MQDHNVNEFTKLQNLIPALTKKEELYQLNANYTFQELIKFGLNIQFDPELINLDFGNNITIFNVFQNIQNIKWENATPKWENVCDCFGTSILKYAYSNGSYVRLPVEVRRIGLITYKNLRLDFSNNTCWDLRTEDIFNKKTIDISKLTKKKYIFLHTEITKNLVSCFINHKDLIQDLVNKIDLELCKLEHNRLTSRIWKIFLNTTNSRDILLQSMLPKFHKQCMNARFKKREIYIPPQEINKELTDIYFLSLLKNKGFLWSYEETRKINEDQAQFINDNIKELDFSKFITMVTKSDDLVTFTHNIKLLQPVVRQLSYSQVQCLISEVTYSKNTYFVDTAEKAKIIKTKIEALDIITTCHPTNEVEKLTTKMLSEYKAELKDINKKLI